jgi:hypothetical protein
MSFTIQYVYGSANTNYWNFVFLYQYKIESWLSNNKCDEVLNIVDDENKNIQILHKSKGIDISIELQKSADDEYLSFIINSNIADKILLDSFLTLMDQLNQQIMEDHKEREKELEYDHQELCNIEYAMSRT